MSEQRKPQPWYRRSAEAPHAEPWPGVIRKTLVWGDRTMLCEIAIAEGQTVAAHHHPYEQIGYVAKGRLQFIVDGQKAVLGVGDAYLIPSNLTHEVLALEDSIAIDVFSPPREDYM